MSQSSTIAFALIVGFFVFITIRGELGQYLNVIGIGSATQTPATTNTTTSGLSTLPQLPQLGSLA
jgi:hypothetical protein